MGRLLTVKEAADFLHVVPGTIYHWISQGRLPVVRFSKRCVRFREEDFTKLLDQLQRASNEKRHK